MDASAQYACVVVTCVCRARVSTANTGVAVWWMLTGAVCTHSTCNVCYSWYCVTVALGTARLRLPAARFRHNRPHNRGRRASVHLPAGVVGLHPYTGQRDRRKHVVRRCDNRVHGTPRHVRVSG